MAVTKFAQNGLNRLGYEVNGEGESKVFILHGLLQTRSTLNPLLDALEGRGTAIAMDLRAHGGSSAVQGLNLRLADLVDDAFAVLDAAEIDTPTVVVGVEIGAVIAQAMKDANPDRVKGLVLINYPTGDMLDDETIRSIANIAYKGQAEQAITRWLDLSWGEGWRDRIPKPRIAAARRSAEAIHPILTALAEADVVEQESMTLPGGAPFAEEGHLNQTLEAIEAAAAE